MSEKRDEEKTKFLMFWLESERGWGESGKWMTYKSDSRETTRALFLYGIFVEKKYMFFVNRVSIKIRLIGYYIIVWFEFI